MGTVLASNPRPFSTRPPDREGTLRTSLTSPRHTQAVSARHQLINAQAFVCDESEPGRPRIRFLKRVDEQVLAQACREWRVCDPQQFPMACAFLDASLARLSSARQRRELLDLYGTRLLEHQPLPWPPGLFDNIRANILSASHKLKPDTPDALRRLILAFHPEAGITQALFALAHQLDGLQGIPLAPKEPLAEHSPHKPAAWPSGPALAGALGELLQQALGLPHPSLASLAVALARRLASLYRSTDQGPQVEALVKALVLQWETWLASEDARWPSAAHRALLGGRRPRIQPRGAGPGLRFAFRSPAKLPARENDIEALCLHWLQNGQAIDAVRLLEGLCATTENAAFRQRLITRLVHWELLITQACQRLFQAGRASEAIALLDALMSTADSPDLHHGLLSALVAEFIEHGDGGPPACQGLGRAILALAVHGWWLPTQRYFLEPRVREALLALSDWDSAVALMCHELALRLDDLSLEEVVIEHLLDHLDRLFQGARERRDGPLMRRVLGFALQLSRRCPETTHLKRCTGLIQACGQALPTLPVHRLHSQLRLTMGLDPQSGEWRVTEIRYPEEPLPDPAAMSLDHKLFYPLELQESPEAQRPLSSEKALLFGDIGRLLEDPLGPSWSQVLKTVSKVLRFGWTPTQRMWLQWCLSEAKRGSKLPLLRELQKIEDKQGESQARDMLFLCLREQLGDGMPWDQRLAITDAVRDELKWELSATHEWALHLCTARRGEAGPLLELLKGTDAPSLLDHARRLDILNLCQDKVLSTNDRARLIQIALPLFDGEPELRRPLETLALAHRWRPSTAGDRRSALVQVPLQRPRPTGDIPEPSDSLVQQARQALSAWLRVDTSQAPVVKTWISRQKAPRNEEEQEHFEAVLFTWMNIELLQRSMSWPQLLGVLDEIETSWSIAINRQRLLDLCVEQVKQQNNLKLLLDHLPKLKDAPPRGRVLARLLDLATQPAWSEVLRAALIQRLIAWLPSDEASGVALHTACVQAMLALPAGDLRDHCLQTYLRAHGGGRSDEARRLFDTAARQDGSSPPDVPAVLRALPRPPAGIAWTAWRALCQTLLERLAAPLSPFLQADGSAPTQASADRLLLDALMRLASPDSADAARDAPHVFDLLVDLTQALPQGDRLATLERLSKAATQWTGAPALKAALRGALHALRNEQRLGGVMLPPLAETSSPVMDEAALLFAHGFTRRLAQRRGDDTSAQASLRELRLRFHQSLTKAHAAAVAQVILDVFGFQPFE